MPRSGLLATSICRISDSRRRIFHPTSRLETTGRNIRPFMMAFAFALALLLISCVPTSPKKSEKSPDGIPNMLMGHFVDDYDIEYIISDSLWVMGEEYKFHIENWYTDSLFVIAQNDINNPSEGGLWTRIDWAALSGNRPFEWAFCLSTFGATTQSEALSIRPNSRVDLKKGCGGFPFSRMRKSDSPHTD